LAKEPKPDIALMDFTMPVMAGREASQQIFRVFPEIPILVLFTPPCGYLAKAASEIGLSGFITKNGGAKIWLP
jgi:DNA-binding NarL/FixJ family response regulator